MHGEGPLVVNIRPFKQKGDLVAFSATVSPCHVFDYDNNQEGNLQIVIPRAKWFDDANADIDNLTDTESEWNESFKRTNKIDRRRFFVINKNDSIEVEVNLTGCSCKVNDNFDPESYLYPKGNVNKNIITQSLNAIPTLFVWESHKLGRWYVPVNNVAHFELNEYETYEKKQEKRIKSKRIIDIREEKKSRSNTNPRSLPGRCNFPSDHPRSCVLSPSLPQNLQDCMRVNAGKYKITGTNHAPHCPPHSAPQPLGMSHGWMQISPYPCGNCGYCDEVFKFGDIMTILISSTESTQQHQQGYPNTVNGGCGRNFEEYYTRIAQPNLTESGEFTVRIQETANVGEGWWVRLTFGVASIMFPGSEYASLTLHGGGEQVIVESNIPDIMNQRVNILEVSARTHIDEYGNEVGAWVDNPVYFHVFFEDDWNDK